jgi:hypothetical protein
MMHACWSDARAGLTNDFAVVLLSALGSSKASPWDVTTLHDHDGCTLE